MDDDSAVLNAEVQRWLLLAMPWWSSPPGNPNRLSSGPETDTCHEVSTSPLALLDPKKVRGFFKAIRQCMAADLISGDAMIGGPGQIVEIDESKFGKRKFNCGRRVIGKWVIGGVARGSGECFLAECPNNKRDANTLCLLILQFVRPGTTIITDKWKGYLPLKRTNTIEGTWFHTKRHVKRGHGRVRTDGTALSIALYEFMWMRRHGLTHSDPDCRRLFNKELPLLFKRLFE